MLRKPLTKALKRFRRSYFPNMTEFEYSVVLGMAATLVILGIAVVAAVAEWITRS